MRKLTTAQIMMAAMDAGFMISTMHGEDDKKLMPVSDTATLIKFAEKLRENYGKTSVT